MKKPTTNKLLITALLFLAVIIFLFSKCTTTKKIFSPDQQYSVYAQSYWYSEIACAAFSVMDCSYAGVIYLYDEKEETVLESVYSNNIASYESVSWSVHDEKVLFKDSGIELENNFWQLPRTMTKL